VLAYLHGLNPDIPHVTTVQSLAFIAVVLIVVTVASWLKVRKDPEARAHAGRMTTGHHEDNPAGD
jgi:tellurite resistance protein TerC